MGGKANQVIREILWRNEKFGQGARKVIKNDEVENVMDGGI